MNKLLNYFKKNQVGVPISLGIQLNKVPFHLRPGIGKVYAAQKKAIADYSGKSDSERKKYIFDQFYRVFCYAYHNTKFYKNLYSKHNITPENLRCYDDINKVPIISKKDFLLCDIEDRSCPIKNRVIVNTGGSSGKALSFYMDPLRYGNEWSHIHDMWSKLDYKPSSLKMIFDGRVKQNNQIVYDFVRNSLLFNIYSNPSELLNQMIELSRRFQIEYLHGYPSAIYEFALYCEKESELKNSLRESLKGAFLSSEYPSPHYRNKIEEVFEIPTQSFYGHTETCVLAVEGEKFNYFPYQTYGYAESIEHEGKCSLVGTSYFNFASPFIRYNTEDFIDPVYESDILKSFVIKEGRVGEYVLDKNNKKIPLTGLIFGRHHKLFDVCEHLQIHQKEKGLAIIFYVSQDKISSTEASQLFNSSNVDIDFVFKQVNKPFLTKSGKANLLVKNID